MLYVYNCSSAVDYAAQKPQAKRIDYNTQRVIEQREYESWVRKIEEIKQRLIEFWILTVN